MAVSFSAVVLAAGRSTRMGADKALLHAGGRPLWERQRDVLVAAGASEVFLSVRPDQAWAHEAPGFSGLIHDALPDCGPIVGLSAGLERMSHRHLAVLAIDLPELTEEWFRELAAAASPGQGLVGRIGRYFEPLAAIYPVELKWLAWETIARGEYSLQAMLGAAVKQGLMRVREIGSAETRWFRNWNEPAG
ncbi:MAG TPA: molybdenum cofactor guanylyltransferase [Opitutaceae bacterium]|nr:molybdenum cofactor guanylyltransferase [Opitutaceae bacterium]